MKVIVVANQKGGVGKTSSAVEIAACLVYEGKKVLFIDLDQQVNSTTYLGLPKVQTAPTSYEVLCGDASIIESIQRRNFKGVGDIDVIPASEKLSTIEKLFPEAEDVFMLADRIDELDENENIKNLNLLTSVVQPFSQVLEEDEEWNYDVLHAEISQIVRSQYGEFYQK